MRLIVRDDIEGWAQRYDSKGDFPVLVSRLIRATNASITFIQFPAGSATSIGGWDGIAICNQASPYVPQGKSLWEFGMEKGVKGKADEDYEKRTDDPLGHNPKESSFIFVTPRYWRDKDKWIAKRMAEGKWKEIRVYDSTNIEEWLDDANAVSRWFSGYISKYPLDGIITIEEFWQEWALGPKGNLPPKSVTSGREHESTQLLNFLNGPAGIRGVKASSKDEAIAFIVASAIQFEEHAKEKFFSKSLIIDTSANFRSVRKNRTALNLIAKFDEAGILFAAASDGHHVLAPVGPDDQMPHETITLPLIDRDGQISSLVSLGFSHEEAAKLSREAGRNITVLKRLLGHYVNRFEWAKPENAQDLIPALLLGRWDERRVGDRRLIELLAGITFEEYVKKLMVWRDYDTPPVIQIGPTWRLTSPLDAWTNLSPFIKQEDIKLLEVVFDTAFQNGNPDIKPTGDDLYSAFITPEKTFSEWAREGLAQSMILVALYGNGLHIPGLASSQQWVDHILSNLLNDGNDDLWVSLNKELPLLAEASPKSFFESINKSLANENPEVLKMFIEVPALLAPTANHTGLLWALEALAWDASYLKDAAKILIKLTALDPGGSITNRPLNSLVEIFKPWHYQTLADFKERIATLEACAEVDRNVAWDFLMCLLPDSLGVGQPTNKMRWRLFERSFQNLYTWEEESETHGFIISLTLKNFDNSEEKLAQLIEKSPRLTENNRNTILQFANDVFDRIKLTAFLPWHTLRKVIAHHRSYPGAPWAMSKYELEPYQQLYQKYEPTDPLQKNLWLFNEDWPEFPEGLTEEDEISDTGADKHLRRVEQSRETALREIISATNLQRVKKLSLEVKEPMALGDALARIIDDDDVLEISDLLNDPKALPFVQSFFFRKSFINGLPWVTSLYKKLLAQGYGTKALAQLFIPLPASGELWDFLDSVDSEIKSEYWMSIYPRFFSLKSAEISRGIEYLLTFNRFVTAIDLASHVLEHLPTELIIVLLQRAATEKTIEDRTLRGYEVGRLFQALDARSDVNQSELIQLEWFYLPILSAYEAHRKPKILHDELAKQPEFFVDVLTWIYKPQNEEKVEPERSGISEEILQQRASHGYSLLRSWKKIPGIREDGTIDGQVLYNWVQSARDLATKKDRISVADMHIGQILAQYPEAKAEMWPPTEISEILEKFNTDSLRRNFGAATSNKHGSSVRGPFDGGDIERRHAEFFNRMAIKHRSTHPVTASILEQLANQFDYDAKLRDQEAERDKLDA